MSRIAIVIFQIRTWMKYLYHNRETSNGWADCSVLEVMPELSQ